MVRLPIVAFVVVRLVVVRMTARAIVVVGVVSHPFVRAPHPHAVAGGRAILHNASRVGHRALTIRSRGRGARGSRRPTRAAILDKGFDGARRAKNRRTSETTRSLHRTVP